MSLKNLSACQKQNHWNHSRHPLACSFTSNTHLEWTRLFYKVFSILAALKQILADLLASHRERCSNLHFKTFGVSLEDIHKRRVDVNSSVIRIVNDYPVTQTTTMRRFLPMRRWHCITSQPIANALLLWLVLQTVGRMSWDRDCCLVSLTGLEVLFLVSTRCCLIRDFVCFSELLLSTDAFGFIIPHILSQILLSHQTQHGTGGTVKWTGVTTALCHARPLRWILQQGSSLSQESLRRTCTAPAQILCGSLSIAARFASYVCTLRWERENIGMRDIRVLQCLLSSLVTVDCIIP